MRSAYLLSALPDTGEAVQRCLMSLGGTGIVGLGVNISDYDRFGQRAMVLVETVQREWWLDEPWDEPDLSRTELAVEDLLNMSAGYMECANYPYFLHVATTVQDLLEVPIYILDNNNKVVPVTGASISDFDLG